MCPICILTAIVLGPGLVTACGINWLGMKCRKNGEADCAGSLTLGLSAIPEDTADLEGAAKFADEPAAR
jgi:hypothetical protein